MEQDLHVVYQDTPRTALGEGPCWHAKKKLLYWIDIRRGLVHIYDPKSHKDETIDVKALVGCGISASC